MDFLDKLRNKPEAEKKFILWTVIIIIGAIFIFLWLFISGKRLSEFRGSEFLGGIGLPAKEELPSMDLNKIEETLNNLENGQKEQPSN